LGVFAWTGEVFVCLLSARGLGTAQRLVLLALLTVIQSVVPVILTARRVHLGSRR